MTMTKDIDHDAVEARNAEIAADEILEQMNARASHFNLKLYRLERGDLIARSTVNSATTREGRVMFHYINCSDVYVHFAELEKATR